MPAFQQLDALLQPGNVVAQRVYVAGQRGCDGRPHQHARFVRHVFGSRSGKARRHIVAARKCVLRGADNAFGRHIANHSAEILCDIPAQRFEHLTQRLGQCRVASDPRFAHHAQALMRQPQQRIGG